MKTDKINVTDSTYFVRNTKQVIESLFAGYCTTASGTFKALKNRVMFYDMQGNLFAALIVNKHGDEPFFVNATKMDDGKIYYQNALGESQERKLGIDHCGYISQRDKAANVAFQLGMRA